VMGFDPAAARAAGLQVVDGNTKDRPPVPAGTEALLIKVQISNAGARTYSSRDPQTGGRAVGAEFPLVDPRTGKRQATWGAQDPCVYEPDKPAQTESGDGCLDSGLIFGGAFPWETNMLALSDIAKAQSWTMTPALPAIQAAMRERCARGWWTARNLRGQRPGPVRHYYRQGPAQGPFALRPSGQPCGGADPVSGCAGIFRDARRSVVPLRVRAGLLTVALQRCWGWYSGVFRVRIAA
jgi:hypothetical protein